MLPNIGICGCYLSESMQSLSRRPTRVDYVCCSALASNSGFNCQRSRIQCIRLFPMVSNGFKTITTLILLANLSSGSAQLQVYTLHSMTKFWSIDLAGWTFFEGRLGKDIEGLGWGMVVSMCVWCEEEYNGCDSYALLSDCTTVFRILRSDFKSAACLALKTWNQAYILIQYPPGLSRYREAVLRMPNLSSIADSSGCW